LNQNLPDSSDNQSKIITIFYPKGTPFFHAGVESLPEMI
jgi:hypothetical protein